MCNNEKNVLSPVHDDNIKIGLDSIPEYQKRQLAKAVLDMVQELFSQPGEEERYQAWLQDRKQKSKGK